MLQRKEKMKANTKKTAIMDYKTHHETCYRYHPQCAVERINEAMRFISHNTKYAPVELTKILEILRGLWGGAK